MRKRLYIAALLAALLLLAAVGCTDNARARRFGGTAKVDLPANQKLITVAWKEASLWYLTRPMREGEVAETYTLKESSSYGLVEGTVKLHEVVESE